MKTRLIPALIMITATVSAGEPNELEGKARQLIEQLAATDFDAREKAEAALKDLGADAVPLLRKLTDVQDDTETRRRLERVLAAYAAGAPLWEFDAKLSGRVLIIGGGKVFLQTGEATLSALEADNGKKVWETNADEMPPAAPGKKRDGGGNILAAYANGKVFVTGVAGTLYALDAATGKTIWKAATEPVDRSHPIVVAERIYFGSREGNFFCVNTADGKIVWQQQRGPASTAAVEGERVWLVDKDYKALSCLSTIDGAEVWSVKIAKSPFCAPALGDGKVIVGDQSGTLQAFTPADGKQLWQFATGFALELGSPLLHNGRVFVGMNGQDFLCINAKDGKKVWQYKVTGASFLPPLAADDFVYVGGYGDKYHLLRAGKGVPHVEWRMSNMVFVHAMAAGRLYYLTLDNKLKCVRAGAQGGEDYPMFGGSATRGQN